MLIVTLGLEILFMLALPAALWLITRRWPGVTWGLIGAGAVTFIVSQIVHIPLNWALGLTTGDRGVGLWPIPLMALVVGLSAGLCEEIARYLVLRFWRRADRSWHQGVAFGAGHGGAESVLIGLITLITFVQMLALRGMDLSALGLSGEALEQARTQMEAFWTTPWYLPLLGGLERALAITMHIAWSLLVVRALTHRNLGWLGVAILGHALVDGVAVGLAQSGWALEAIEGVVFPLALVALAVILILRKAPQPAGTDVSRETLT